MKAIQVESFRWCSFTALLGFTLFRNDEQLPGMITVPKSDIANSLKNEVQRYLTQYYVSQKNADGTRTLSSGPFAEVTYDEVLKAIQEAMSA